MERQFAGIVEVDESYFGPRRVKGKAGRGAGRKTPVFGTFKRHGKVYTEIVPDCSKAVLSAATRGKVSLNSIICSDVWRGYDGLVDLGYKKHLRIDHSRNEFSSRRVRGNHINGIEGSGATPRAACPGLGACTRRRSSSTSRSASSASTTATKTCTTCYSGAVANTR